MTLEEALRRRASTLGSVSLFRTANGRWQGNAKDLGEAGYKVHTSDDPAKALLDAISPRYDHPWPDLPKPRRRLDDIL